MLHASSVASIVAPQGPLETPRMTHARTQNGRLDTSLWFREVRLNTSFSLSRKAAMVYGSIDVRTSYPLGVGSLAAGRILLFGHRNRAAFLRTTKKRFACKAPSVRSTSKQAHAHEPRDARRLEAPRIYVAAGVLRLSIRFTNLSSTLISNRLPRRSTQMLKHMLPNFIAHGYGEHSQSCLEAIHSHKHGHAYRVKIHNKNIQSKEHSLDVGYSTMISVRCWCTMSWP